MDWLKEFLKPEIIWFLIGLLLMLLEFAMPGLIIMFFGIGACVTALVCIFADISVNVQILIFLITSIVALLALRRAIKNVFTGKSTYATGNDYDKTDSVGQTAAAKQNIAKGATGKVEFQGSDWNAVALENIAEGQQVLIVGQEGLTLKVKVAK